MEVSQESLVAFRKVVWSIVEEEYLKKHADDPMNRLCIQLSKSRNAIKNKLAEFDGKSIKKTKKKSMSKIGKRKDCNNMFFRSGWEANCYRFFKHNQKLLKIKLIEYEPTDFNFWEFGVSIPVHNLDISILPGFNIMIGFQ